MKLLTTYEAKNAFPRVLKLSRREVVIVTNPAAGPYTVRRQICE